jgi:hypothetical protein
MQGISDECWWCDVRKRQSREHLFKECVHRRGEIKELWRRVHREVGWRNHRWKPISSLFTEKKATGETLEFLGKTGAGKLRGSVGMDGDDGDEAED